MMRVLSLTVERVAFNHRDAGSTPAEHTNRTRDRRRTVRA